MKITSTLIPDPLVIAGITCHADPTAKLTRHSLVIYATSATGKCTVFYNIRDFVSDVEMDALPEDRHSQEYVDRICERIRFDMPDHISLSDGTTAYPYDLSAAKSALNKVVQHHIGAFGAEPLKIRFRNDYDFLVLDAATGGTTVVGAGGYCTCYGVSRPDDEYPDSDISCVCSPVEIYHLYHACISNQSVNF